MMVCCCDHFVMQEEDQRWKRVAGKRYVEMIMIWQNDDDDGKLDSASQDSQRDQVRKQHKKQDNKKRE